jgi:hypothetical protein
MAFLTMEVSGRHARTRAITRDTVSPANQTDLAAADMSRDVARVVSDVSVLCPRVVVCFGNPGVGRREDATSSVTGRSLCSDVGRRVTPISLVSGSFRVCCFAFRMVAGAVVSAFWATSGPANGASNWAVSNTDG